MDGVNNPDGPNGDSVEAYLDVEWSGAVAPDATIDLVVAADTSLESGLILAMEHAVYGNVAPVISLSFGECEAQPRGHQLVPQRAVGAGSRARPNRHGLVRRQWLCGLRQRRLAGIRRRGQAVNGFASTPYNVAVGGTDFYYTDYATGGASIANYWNTTTSQLPAVSILGYIPEQPWNDGQYGLNIFNQFTRIAATIIAGGSGGASNAAVCSNNSYSATTGVCTGTESGYPKPSWQTGAGVPNDSVRDLPDVSLFAANGDNYSFYPICATDGDCQTAGLGSNLVQIFGVGGTSASSPAFAGMMALVIEKWGRQGQADNILYALKTQYPAAFHDVTAGTNSMPCEFAPTVTPNCISAGAGAIVLDGITEGKIGTGTTPEYNAAAGYNLATGLGTIDATNLVNNWASVKLGRHRDHDDATPRPASPTEPLSPSAAPSPGPARPPATWR